MEIWKDVIGFENLYQVSNIGRVRSLDKMVKNQHKEYFKKGRVLKLGNDNNGYYRVVLRKNNKSYDIKVHRLVAKAFLPFIPNKNHINHKDCNPHNNNVENLEWCTPRENIIHAYVNGRRKTVKVNMYDLEMNFIKSFNSYKDAVIFLRKNGYLKAAYPNIAKCINGKRKKAYGFKWELKE